MTDSYGAQVRAQLAQVQAELAAAEAERDGAYRERAQLVAWLAALNPAVLVAAPDVDEPGWQVLYLTAGGQQLSWHIAPADADLFTHVEQVQAGDPRAQWDGHTTGEKYERVRALIEPCAGRACAGSGCSHERAWRELVMDHGPTDGRP